MNAQKVGRLTASTVNRPSLTRNRWEPSTGFVHSITSARTRKHHRPLTPDKCGPARGMVIGLIFGSLFWVFLFAAAWAVDRHPLTTGALALVALVTYIIVKAGRM